MSRLLKEDSKIKNNSIEDSIIKNNSIEGNSLIKNITPLKKWLTSNNYVKFYLNADTQKTDILLENNGKTGIYMWTHLESGSIYIGSAINLRTRLLQ